MADLSTERLTGLISAIGSSATITMMKPELLLTRGLEELGIGCSTDHVMKFMTFMSELQKWNRTYNLTAITSDTDIITKHFLDSLLYLKGVPKKARRIADAGSGAGFPGIPIKIMRREAEISLIEPSRKKASFLRHIVRVLGMTGLQVIEERIENLCARKNLPYDVIVSRATFKIREILEQTCPYLNSNCLIVLSKGPGVLKELEFLQRTSRYRDTVREVLNLRLPLSHTMRTLIILKCGRASS